MTRRTPLYQSHIAAGARMVDFSGWEMPLHYGSQLAEHHHVRRDVGMFDVSHMRITEVEGPGSLAFLRQLLANDCARLSVAGRALYSCMLNENGGVLDDLIVYRRSESAWRIVSNAGTRECVDAWLHARRGEGVTLRGRDDLAIIAVQGPGSRSTCVPLLPAALRDEAMDLEPFQACGSAEYFVACSGYTGEDGLEIMLPAIQAAGLWRQLLQAGAAPAGLGARDSLRLEAGMNLYGQDMDSAISPLEAGLAWTVAWEPGERNFIGRAALARQREAGLTQRRCGVILEGRGVLRHGMQIVDTDGHSGIVTSGGFSPSLGRAIGLARVPVNMGRELWMTLRGRQLPLRRVSPPFVRKGASCVAGLEVEAPANTIDAASWTGRPV